MIKSVVEQIRVLDAQKAKIITAAKREATKKVEQAIKELNQLGFNYRLVSDGSVRIGKKPKMRRKKGTVSTEACKICRFRTVPPHDARSHRGQSRKAPFTREELAERGLRCRG